MNKSTSAFFKPHDPQGGIESEVDQILMAEDNSVDRELISQMLRQAFGDTCTVVCVDCFDNIVTALSNDSYQALILDMNLPDRSGLENITELGKLYPKLPIIVLTGSEDQEQAVLSLQQGAQDYLYKNQVTPEILSRSLRYAKQRKNTEIKLKHALEDSADKNEQLQILANHDPLTGLPNRSYFRDAAMRILKRADRAQKQVALLYFDLNGFKKVNDSFGHLIGDELLKQVSTRVKSVVRDTDFLARIGGDEFVVISDLLDNKKQIYPLVKRILKEFEKPFEIATQQITSIASIGIAFYPAADSLDLLVKQADSAMYQAKNQVNNPVCSFTGKIASQFSRNQKIEHELGAALENREFEAWFQPLIKPKDSGFIMAEALARWNSVKLGWINTAEFIGLAEHTPAINEITHAVLVDCQKFYLGLTNKHACLEKIAVNVSASQLSDGQFCKLFMRWLEQLELPPQTICLELTERQMVQNADACRKQIARLRSAGIRMALDDFGSGFSSITHLVDLPLDILKLDRCLIDQIDSNSRNQAITAGIVEMAHRLDMEVVAEGIETNQEYEMAIELGCDYLQGYFIAKPAPIDQALSFYQC